MATAYPSRPSIIAGDFPMVPAARGWPPSSPSTHSRRLDCASGWRSVTQRQGADFEDFYQRRSVNISDVRFPLVEGPFLGHSWRRARPRNLLSGGKQPRRTLRRDVFHCGADYRNLLPAKLPSAYAEARKRTVLPLGGGSADRWLPRLSAMPARRQPRCTGMEPASRSRGRAMRLVADGIVDREGVAGLAARLGYSERQIHRALSQEVGAGPLRLARAQRAQTARILLETTDLGVTDVSYVASFASIRQFNDTMREIFASTPSDLRRRSRRGPGAHRLVAGPIELRLPYRRPADLTGIVAFLSTRAVPGVEEVEGGTYRRILSCRMAPASPS